MTDYFDIHMTAEELGAVSNLGLAHLGDCVYELMVRSHTVCGGKHTNAGMHDAALRFVSAPAQARAMEKLLPLLTEEEAAVYRRGRNSHVNSVPKHAAVGDYHAATGLECLFGWLYLRGERTRICALFDVIVAGEEEK